MAHEQITFLASLDFPDRTTLTVSEVALRLGVDPQHLLNLIQEGEFLGLDLKGKKATKRCIRIPIEVYRNFVLSRFTGPQRVQAVLNLPEPVLRELYREIGDRLRRTAA